ncbi:hypothetical protein BH10PSE18_BH10PSE18_33990 [soil metagenome]
MPVLSLLDDGLQYTTAGVANDLASYDDRIPKTLFKEPLHVAI